MDYEECDVSIDQDSNNDNDSAIKQLKAVSKALKNLVHEPNKSVNME